ncbi:hypothetical protein Q8W71_30655 [Methylobacterium sp. NEAU 140]|uniref:hypothetical protein n=1 Tax=Methylobacterium sp. NEAU 140 TaxID=3064945 RepID=UPI002734F1D6|nr:hypothetical protein [Methylobacterium sp. NEAU 140]MDP4026953.1 hypothetical protein [Methylobacterium sp. NEAU 140]
MAVCSAAMEHYRSTLATTACAVFGLITAAHVLHPGNFEEQSRRARPVAAQREAATAWTDPAPVLRSHTVPVETTALAPRMTMPLPAGATMMPALPASLSMPANSPASARAARPRKAAQRPVRQRQATLALARTTPAPTTSTAAPKAASGSLADLLRGLGLDRDG